MLGVLADMMRKRRQRKKRSHALFNCSFNRSIRAQGTILWNQYRLHKTVGLENRTEKSIDIAYIVAGRKIHAVSYTHLTLPTKA